MVVTDFGPGRIGLLAVACVGLFLGSFGSNATVAAETPQLEVEDHFDLHRVTELVISSDGKMVAYAIERQSLEENRTMRDIYVRAVKPDAEPTIIGDIQQGRAFAWIPGSKELAFLMKYEGGKTADTNVYSFDLQTKDLIQHTFTDDPVSAFKFSPDGTKLAYVTQERTVRESPYERFFNGDKGVVTNPETLKVYYLLNKDRRDWRMRAENRLWVGQSNHTPKTILLDGEIDAFHWSPDGNWLSATFVSRDLPNDFASSALTNMSVIEVATGDVKLVAKATPATDGEFATSFRGGEWLPDGDRIHIQRVLRHDAWDVRVHWTIIDPFSPDWTLDDWYEIEQASQEEFIAAGPQTFYLKRIVNAVESLYRLSSNGIAPAAIVEHLPGAVKLFSFADDFKSAVFGYETLSSPPELYRWESGLGIQKISSMNAGVAEKAAVRWREVEWFAKDGVAVHGWLLTPSKVDGPMPLLTYVHGGPAAPARHEFSSVFQSNWSYPFLTLAQAGIAVFQPNYRGTSSFGVEHREPRSLDGEPVEDIIAGVDYLVEQGIADPNRLAIAGHSHGAWLAPMVMIRDQRYVAGSFAEGTQNTIVNYNLTPMYLNLITHDVQSGVSLYDDPGHYIDQSPDLHFRGLKTAMLFEAGVKSLSVNMIGSQKAALRAGLPSEYIIYPKTGHVMSIPSLRRESASRNLDWFRFWLQGYEDPDPQKAEQYQRWRTMRQDSCSLSEAPLPNYCDFD